jgi:isopentenyldiphosphate isomerase
MESLKRALTFNVKGNQYNIKTPTSGQLWDVEEMKALLTNGQYGNVLNHRTYWSEYNLDNVDMFAYISVLCPQVIKDLEVETWKDLDPFDLAELKNAYKKQFLPWYNEFTKMLKSVEKQNVDSPDEKSDK